MKWFASIVLASLLSFVVAKCFVVPSSSFKGYLANVHFGLDTIIPGIVVDGLCVGATREETERCDSPFPAELDNYCDFIGCDQVDEITSIPIPEAVFPREWNCNFTGGLEYSDLLDEVALQSHPNELISTSTAVGLWCTRQAVCEAGTPDAELDCKTFTWDPTAPNGGKGVWAGRCVLNQGFEGYCRTCRKIYPTVDPMTGTPSEWNRFNDWFHSTTLRTYFIDEPCDIGVGTP